jgi:hypothetical protein
VYSILVMPTNSGPHFANVVQMVNMSGGNADSVNGYYIPTSARLFSFPIYTKYCERSNRMTATKLCLFYEKRRYYWVVRDSDDKIIARVKYPPFSQSSLSLPEHIPDTLTWELLSTGFFGNFKKKYTARVQMCSDNALLQQMSSFIGPGSGYMDSVSESIRFIDSTVQDLETLLVDVGGGGDSHTHTDDEHNLSANIDIENMPLDRIIELYSQEIFNGYGALVPHEQNHNASHGIPFASLQEKLEEKVSSSLLSALDTQKVRPCHHNWPTSHLPTPCC